MIETITILSCVLFVCFSFFLICRKDNHSDRNGMERAEDANERIEELQSAESDGIGDAQSTVEQLRKSVEQLKESERTTEERIRQAEDIIKQVEERNAQV